MTKLRKAIKAKTDSDQKDEAQAKLATVYLPLGVYRHRKGGEYVVFALTLSETTLEPMVHYWSISKRTRWTRTLKQFTEMPRGTYTKRFVWGRMATPEEMMAAAGITVGITPFVARRELLRRE